MRRKKGVRDTKQKEIWNNKHEAICAIIKRKPGIRRLNIHTELGISRRIINKHLRSEPNIREDKRALYWDTHYEKKKELDKLFKFLYLTDLQRQQQPLGRYVVIDVGEDSVLYDSVTGERVFTIHNMRVRDTGEKILIRVPKTERVEKRD